MLTSLIVIPDSYVLEAVTRQTLDCVTERGLGGVWEVGVAHVGEPLRVQIDIQVRWQIWGHIAETLECLLS